MDFRIDVSGADHRLVRRAWLAATLLFIAGLATPPVSAAPFFVTDVVDAIPPPPGSLRWAIEQSELNGERDVILFQIDGGTIDLVAPLPDLLEGQLSIGSPDISPVDPACPTCAPTGGSAIFVNGGGTIVHAIAVRSEGNLISELEFIGFTNEAILIRGSEADNNTVSRCVFGRTSPATPNFGAGIRVQPDSLSVGTPSGTTVRLSRFVLNGSGVVIEGDGVLDPDVTTADRGSTIENNWFGTNALGSAGSGNGEAIRAFDAGPVAIRSNRLSGPGRGISLEAGSHRSRVESNEIGVLDNSFTLCSGFTGAALLVAGSNQVVVQDNSIVCSDTGLLLGPDTLAASVLGNTIGGDVPRGHIGNGISINGSGGSLITDNLISGNGGFGIGATPGPIIDPPPGNVISCNSIFRNGSGAISLPGIPTVAPLLTAATPVDVVGDTNNPLPGWAEVFGDDAAQARLFQGATRLADDSTDPTLKHPLPVLGMRLAKSGLSPTTAVISFDRETPDNHTATFTGQALLQTSELSPALAAETTGLVFDVVRGNVANLEFVGTGGIGLGPLDCLASGLDPDIAISPDVVDPDVPASGESFFYLARRRPSLANRRGTYDPALCLTIVDTFEGPRIPGDGDCP